jgi:hypothetical protein
MQRRKSIEHFVVCVKNEGYAASLEIRKIYVAHDDPDAARRKLIRVVDESGEDYLYPQDYFIAVELPAAAARAIGAAT